MKINFLGDSITAGATLDKPEEMYTYLVCKHFGAKENNYGKGGTCIARDYTSIGSYGEDFNQRALFMDKTADFVFVFGGTNDYGHGTASIGDLTDQTPYTFIGSLNILSRYLTDTYGLEKLCFILPLHRRNEENEYGENGAKKEPSLPLCGYVAVMKEVLQKYSIDFLDFSKDFTSENLDVLTNDGLHPNAEGHRLIARKMIAYLGQKLGST
mgnify:CR=1 FL=1